MIQNKHDGDDYSLVDVRVKSKRAGTRRRRVIWICVSGTYRQSEVDVSVDGDHASDECLVSAVDCARASVARPVSVPRCVAMLETAAGSELPNHSLGIESSLPPDSYKTPKLSAVSGTHLKRRTVLQDRARNRVDPAHDERREGDRRKKHPLMWGGRPRKS